MAYPFSFPNTYAAGERTSGDLWQEDLDALQAEFPLGPDYFSNGVFIKCVVMWDEKIPIWAFPPEIAKRKNRSPDPEAPPLGWHAFDPLFINSFNLLYERAFADEIKPAGFLKRVGRVTGAMRSTVPLAIMTDNEDFSVHQVTWDGDATGGQWKLYSTAEIRSYYATSGAVWTIEPGGADGTLVKGFDPDVDFDDHSLYGYQKMYLADCLRLKDSKVIALGSIVGGGCMWDIDGSTASPTKLSSGSLKTNVAKMYPNYNGEFVYVFPSSWYVPSLGGPSQDSWNAQRIQMRRNASSGSRQVATLQPGGGFLAPYFQGQPRGMDGTVCYPYARNDLGVSGTTALVVTAAGGWGSAQDYVNISCYNGDHGSSSGSTSVAWEANITDLPALSSLKCVQNFRTYLFVVSSDGNGIHWALVVPHSGGGTAQSVCSGSYTTGKGSDWTDVVPRSSSCDGESIYMMLDNGKIWRWDLRLAARASGSQGEVFTARANSTVAETEELFGADEFYAGDVFDPRGRFWSNTSFALNGVILNRFSNTGDGDTTVIAPVK